MKEDKTTAKVDDVLDFMVVDFSKESKKIHLSHTKTWQASKDDEEKQKEDEARKQAKEIAKINESNVEKATLGDLDVLQSLKEDLEKEGR
jgi:small subunit ribosomal protein S1